MSIVNLIFLFNNLFCSCFLKTNKPGSMSNPLYKPNLTNSHPSPPISFFFAFSKNSAFTDLILSFLLFFCFSSISSLNHLHSCLLQQFYVFLKKFLLTYSFLLSFFLSFFLFNLISIIPSVFFLSFQINFYNSLFLFFIPSSLSYLYYSSSSSSYVINIIMIIIAKISTVT